MIRARCEGSGASPCRLGGWQVAHTGKHYCADERYSAAHCKLKTVNSRAVRIDWPAAVTCCNA
eukprot:1174738-Pleurochrysis_carterae.AAC.2